MNDLYLWLKAGHVISVIAWMAGIFYLPRLFVYHVEQRDAVPQMIPVLEVMERRLLQAIMTPAMIATWVFGLSIVGMGGVDWGEVVEAGAIALLVGGVLIAKWRDLLLHAFDPQQARAIGLSTRLLHYGLLCILALTIVGALRATGIILTIAMLIAPGAIAFLLTDRFARMLPIAVLVAVGATFTGVWLSFFLDSAPAPTIVLVLTAIFVVVFVARTRRTGQHGALAAD